MRINILFVTVATLFLVLSCNKKSDPSPDSDNAEFVYTPEAIILEKSEVDPVQDISSDGKTYVMSKDVFKNQPKNGETFLVPGLHMRKVVSAKSVGSNYELITEDAALTDIIKDGTLSYEITPAWGTEEALLVDGKKAKKVYGNKDNVIEYVFSAKGVDYKINIEPILSGGTISTCKFKMQMVKKSGGAPNVSLVGEGTMTLPKQNTNITIKDGSLESFNSTNKGISGTINLSIYAADGEPGETTEVLPNIALTFPIRYLPTPYGPIPNPIPMSIEVGVNFVTSISFSGNLSSATAKSTVTFDADNGFDFSGGNMNTTGTLNNEQITGGQFDSAGLIGSELDVQFGIAFPRIALKVADQELAYVHVGFTTGSKLQWGPICKSGYTKIVVEGGYGLKVLGSTLFGQKTTFVERKKEAKGEGCS
ncbi:hypothetical protein EGI22_22920 [Lacihabitans sp. LS3-19]|uniref:hypothetical protein n=1 Tax=Lacihabitans sp. LS3-19 TaxID=2487335 RepID=UPI0020CCB991|nr:hypothetical protein [Lacihabitans sp. LS3-19]MCP9770767.1 hypothetical protein [Lacihabitans sp. LS3-19]